MSARTGCASRRRVLRAAGRITGEKQFVIIGNRSLHGKYPDLADELVASAEADLIAKRDTTRTEWLNVIGQAKQDNGLHPPTLRISLLPGSRLHLASRDAISARLVTANWTGD